MERRPLRIACIADRALVDSNWVWIKNKIAYPHPLDWQFFLSGPQGRIDRFLGRPLLGRVLVGLRLRRAVQRGEIDLMVSHLPYCTSWISLLLMGAQGKAYHLAFGFNFTDLPTGLSRWLMTRSFRRVKRFVVFSNMEKQLYREYFGIPEEKFEQIAWGVAPPIDEPGPRQIETPYVVSMGGEARDYSTLVETARAMKDTLFVLIVRPTSLSGDRKSVV